MRNALSRCFHYYWDNVHILLAVRHRFTVFRRVSSRKGRTPGNVSVSPCFKGGELITDSSLGILFYQSNYNDSNSILTAYPFAERRRIREGAKPYYSTSKGLSWIAHFQIDGIGASHLSWKVLSSLWNYTKKNRHRKSREERSEASKLGIYYSVR